MVSTPSVNLSQYPQELISFVTDEAGRDADDVCAFLTAAGLTPTPGTTCALPKGILLDLGGVVRLRRWEAAGFSVHLGAGLPSACEALDSVIRTLFVAAETPAVLALAGALGRAVFDLMVTRFAWTARVELGADIALDVDDEDALVEAVTQFLWANRHHAPITD